jgi:outer membrane immunogenic protein
MPLKAPPTPDPAWSWAGFYGGVSLGARVADNDWSSSNFFPSLVVAPLIQPVTGGAVDSVAARIGGNFGYNWVVAPTWIVGLEGGVGWAPNSKTVNPAPGTAGLSTPACGGLCGGQPNARVEESWDGSLRGRIGSLVTPTTLFFATGGAAWQSIKLSSACSAFIFCSFDESGSASRILTGWTVGTGIEQRISGNWLARIEYSYAQFGTFSHQFFGIVGGADDRYTASVKPQTHTVDVGLTYKF